MNNEEDLSQKEIKKELSYLIDDFTLELARDNLKKMITFWGPLREDTYLDKISLISSTNLSLIRTQIATLLCHFKDQFSMDNIDKIYLKSFLNAIKTYIEALLISLKNENEKE